MAKGTPAPPTIDKLAPMFQDFYALAASHIATHISTLSLRQKRRQSPPRSSSRSSSIAKTFKTSPLLKTSPSTSRPTSSRSVTERMLTMDEMNDRRKARKALEIKRIAMEEAVERRVCEGVYERIWKHPSTQDDERDEKLRSRTAALSVVGIGLEELGVTFDATKVLPEGTGEQKAAEQQIKEWLAPAREELMRMNETHYPLGKLHHLKAAHKGIVDTLSRIFPSSSSADEILPMLIFTLITTQDEETNVISNLNFTQNFRNENKIDGEAAYCLTNLEAAVTFVETVDLSTLKADEHPSGPVRSRSNTTTIDPDMLPSKAVENGDYSYRPPSPRPASIETFPEIPASPGLAPTPPSQTPSTHQRRISQLLQPPSHVLGAASGAVINTADQGLKTIGNTLESSYKFLFGRLKERQVSGSMAEGSSEIIVPKTLDEARKLVSTPPPASNEGGDEDRGLNIMNGDEIDPLSAQVDGAADDGEPLSRTSTEDRLLGLIGGSSMVRESSRDSSRSSGSGKKVSFSSTRGNAPESILVVQPKTPTPVQPKPQLLSSASLAAVDTMRNFGNSINPLNRLAGLGAMRSFGRSTASLPNMTPTKEKEKEMLDVQTPTPDGRISRLSGDFSEVKELTEVRYLPVNLS
jgi:hypothetical protein